MIGAIEVLILILCGVGGTGVAIALGWSESSEPLDKKKLVSSFIRGSIGAVVYVVGSYALAPAISVWDFVEIAVFAAGFDALVKRGQAVLSK